MLKIKVPKYAQRKVLKPGELKKLMRVKTTKAQAIQIIERNLAVLRGLKRNEHITLPYGCPHCNEDYACEACAWTKGLGKLPGYNPAVERCCIGRCTTFGGVTYAEISNVFSYGYASVTLKFWYRLPACNLSQARVYARGHIQWALAVIAKAKKRRVNHVAR
jgi:hypothetical protein